MDLYSFLLRHETIGKVVHAPRLKINHTNDDFNAMMIATDFYQQDKSIFVVCPNLFQAQKYYETLSHILPEEDVLFFPADELITAEMVAATGDFLFERIQTICTLFSGGKKLVIMNLHGAIKYELPKEIWEGSIFTLRPSMTIEPDDLIHHLLRMGYERVYTITKTGEFAKRGSIVDIFPLGFTSPIRLDFFADEIVFSIWKPNARRRPFLPLRFYRLRRFYMTMWIFVWPKIVSVIFWIRFNFLPWKKK